MLPTIEDHWWTRGYCFTFAARLKQRFGGELWAVVNHSRRYPDDDFLHCYCVIDGVAYDANGGHPVEEASDTSEEKWPIPEMDRDCDVVLEWREVDEECLASVHQDFDPNDCPAADDYIDRHPHLFEDLRGRTP